MGRDAAGHPALPSRSMRHASWIHGPRRDVLLAFCWAPFAGLALVVSPHPHALAAVLSGVLLLSLAHQPVTLALVYGDAERFAEHRRLFSVAPLAALAAVVVGLHVSLGLVAVVAGLWNAEHTLMQRYGITRIYGRKAGDDQGSVEKPMIVSWLVLAALVAAANPRTPRYLARLDVGEINRRGISLLTQHRLEATVLLVPVVVAVAVLSGRWLAGERALAAAGTANPAKWIYVGATAALIVTICLNPVVGFAGYVGGHALEYFVIVHGAAGRRAGSGGGGVVGGVVRSPLGAAGFVAAAAVGALIPLVALSRAGTFLVATGAYLTVGALHIFYDGLIWKLRRPTVARDLGAGPAGPAGAAPDRGPVPVAVPVAGPTRP